MEKWSSESPRVAVTRSVASSADCSHVIGLAEASQRLAPGLTKGNKLAAGRSSDVVWLAHDASPQLWALTQRCAALAERPLRCAEHWQVIRYATGGEYRRHYDAYCPRASKGFAKTTATSGNRVTTCLLYLNTVERGGATRFWRLPSAEDGSGAPPRDVRATEGSVLVFDNCYSAEEGAEEEEKETAPSAATTVAVRHPLSEHSGMPVEAGVKWAANLWFRERPTRQGVATLHRVARQREGAPATSPPLPPSDAAWFARFDELSRDAHVEQAEGRRDAALALLRQAAVHCNMGQLPPRLQRRIDALELEGRGEEEESSRLLPPPPSNPSRSGCCACIFDLDGTLVDSTALAFDATNVVLTAAGYAAVTRDDYHAGCMHTTPRRLALHAIGDPDGLAVGAPLAAAFDAHYIARVDATSAGFFPGVGKMLRELVAMGGGGGGGRRILRVAACGSACSPTRAAITCAKCCGRTYRASSRSRNRAGCLSRRVLCRATHRLIARRSSARTTFRRQSRTPSACGKCSRCWASHRTPRAAGTSGIRPPMATRRAPRASPRSAFRGAHTRASATHRTLM